MSTKTLSLIVMATAVVLTLTGASFASANSTALCKVHQEPCQAANQVKSIHLASVAETVAVVLNSTADILCLQVLGQATVGELASPQTLISTSFFYSNCGTSAAHNNCTVTAEFLPNFILLKIALNLGTLTAVGGLTRLKCTIFGFVKIDCTYINSGTSFGMEGDPGLFLGNGMVTATKSPLALKQEADFVRKAHR